ncbi:MAG: hypothetical protein AAFR04_04940 [Pseudomonadota bacterium]
MKSPNGTRAQTATWHPDEDATPTPEDVAEMAVVLEGRHGLYAAHVADFFAEVHGRSGDAGRSWAWAGVATMIRRREDKRVGRAGPGTSAAR